MSPTPLSKLKIEAAVARNLKLKDVTLTEQGGGRFTGTGKKADGTVVEVEVTQTGNKLKTKEQWTESDGSKMAVEVNGWSAR